ncbi:MAG: DHH family phosphoesterase [Oscillospiraceae bacterium]|nr:DHH family phosphoesterase [Candidatus Equicaccousia limihippi]
MRNSRKIIYTALIIYVAALTAAACYVKPEYCYFLLPAFLLFAVLMVLYVYKNRSRYNSLIKKINSELSKESSSALSNFTLPMVVVSPDDIIIWYNQAFLSSVAGGSDEFVGKNISTIISGQDQELLRKKHRVVINYGDKVFRVFESFSETKDAVQRIIGFTDITKLQKYAIEYSLSKPVVALVAIDNMDEITKNLRDSERTVVRSQIQNELENYFSFCNGLTRRSGDDRFMFVFESRHLNHLKAENFAVLRKVKGITTSVAPPTASIGIGVGGDGLKACEEMATQALDMALGHGGDQVVIKNGENDYAFFGEGNDSPGEKRSAIRARIVAISLKNLMDESENVLIMGHKYTDLDCVGAAYALYKTAVQKGKPAKIVLNQNTTMSNQLIDNIRLNGETFVSIDGKEALSQMTDKTLLIVVDTNRAVYTDYPEVLQAAHNVVVIDHHRLAADSINTKDTSLFYHDPAASSTSEMVTGLIEYIFRTGIDRIQSQALLAGIMLDTRNFVFNTGVQTFSASAFLRKSGANPIEVKKMFADSIDAYKQKARIISSAMLFKDNAIAINDSTDASAKMITAQAADELLEISGVNAGFVMCLLDGKVNISARSLSGNVQIIMEKLGGGGSKTMAACQLETDDFETAKKMLVNAIENN